MNQGNKSEIERIIREINSISNSLDEVADGISRDFKGIGENICCNNIKRISGDYRRIKTRLYRVI